MGTFGMHNQQAAQTAAARLGPIGQQIRTVHAKTALPDLVSAVLNALTSAGEAFTAFDVTLILRGLFPHGQRALPHYDRQGAQGVQTEVHRQMAPRLYAGDYTETVAFPNGRDAARLYSPAR